MAATKRNAMLIEEARTKIQTTQLINRLQDHALGAVELSATQVRSVEILLKKSVPDLTSVALTGGHDGEPVSHELELVSVRKKLIAFADPGTEVEVPGNTDGS